LTGRGEGRIKDLGGCPQIKKKRDAAFQAMGKKKGLRTCGRTCEVHFTEDPGALQVRKKKDPKAKQENDKLGRQVL